MSNISVHTREKTRLGTKSKPPHHQRLGGSVLLAFVEFEDPCDAEDSVRSLDETCWCCGPRIIVEIKFL